MSDGEWEDTNKTRRLALKMIGKALSSDSDLMLTATCNVVEQVSGNVIPCGSNIDAKQEYLAKQAGVLACLLCNKDEDD